MDAGAEFIVRGTDGRPPAAGDSIGLVFPPDRLHLFGPDGRRIMEGPDAGNA